MSHEENMRWLWTDSPYARHIRAAVKEPPWDPMHPCPDCGNLIHVNGGCFACLLEPPMYEQEPNERI